MPILESVLIALGTGVAKHLVTENLPDDWHDKVGSELVGMTIQQLTGRTKKDSVEAAIGRRVDTIYDHSPLAENENNAALAEVILTLDRAITNVEHLIDLDLDAIALQREMISNRPEAANLLGNAGGLYEKMLLEASLGIMQAASRLDEFYTAQVRAQLGRQRVLLRQQQEVLDLLQNLAPSLAHWLEGPTEQAWHFEQAIYRPTVVRKLNKMEPFGIDEGDRYGDSLKLTNTFVQPDLRLELWPVVTRQELESRIAETGTERLAPEEQRLSAFQALAQVERLMVVGAAGSGKSTFLQWLAICAAEQSFPDSLAEWNKLVPFFIRLRDYQNEGFPIPEAFSDKVTPMGAGEMPPGWARSVLRRGEALILVDGVDEMRREDREQMLESMQDLVEMYPLCRFVVSSRPPVVDETRWPAWRDWLQEANFAESWLPDMNWPQIEELVCRWHDALAEVTWGVDAKQEVQQNKGGTVALLQREPNLRKLAGAPLLCTMICTLYQRQGDNISSERLELYENCVNMLLWERDRRHPRRKVPAIKDYPDFNRTQLLMCLSTEK